MNFGTEMDAVAGGLPIRAWPAARSDLRREPAEGAKHPNEVLAKELERNEATLAVLRGLRVPETARLPLAFVFETAGPEADEALAAFLENEAGYDVTIEPDGVSGRTTPVELSSEALEVWIRRMLHAGYWHGGCAFGGWTVAVSRT